MSFTLTKFDNNIPWETLLKTQNIFTTSRAQLILAQRSSAVDQNLVLTQIFIGKAQFRLSYKIVSAKSRFTSACHRIYSDFGMRRMLHFVDWSFASSSWFWYGLWSLIHQCSKFWLSILILKVQGTSMSFKSSFGALEDAGGDWLGFGILILI